MSNIIKRESTGYTLAHVERFVFDPVTPVVLSIKDYAATVEFTDEEALELSAALAAAVTNKEYETVGESENG